MAEPTIGACPLKHSHYTYYGLVSQTIGDDARTESCPRPGVVGNFVGWVATI